MELAGCGDHYAGGGKKEGDEQSNTQIKSGQAAMFLAPPLAQHGVGEKESHVDAHGGSGSSDHLESLLIKDDMIPVVLFR